MDVRGASSFLRRMVILFGHFLRNCPKPKNLDVFINQDPVFGAEAYFEVLLDNKDVPNALISSL